MDSRDKVELFEQLRLGHAVGLRDGLAEEDSTTRSWWTPAPELLQVNLLLPGSLSSPTPYTTVLQLTVGGQPSNVVSLTIQWQPVKVWGRPADSSECMDSQDFVGAIGVRLFPLVLLVGFAISVFRQRRRQGSLDAFLAPYARGDYAAALEATETLRKSVEPRQYWFFRGGFLLQLGRFDEAESSLKEAAALRQAAKFSTLCNQTLGELKIEQRCYDEAVKYFEASLRDWPGNGPSHRGIAESFLRRAYRPAEALDWAKLAVQEDRAIVNERIRSGGPKFQALSELSHNLNLGESLATLAWAVAASVQDRKQVDALTGEAVGLTQGKAVSSSSLVHFHVGLAYAALGDRSLSEHHWNEAARLDLQGRWGRAARSRLTTLSTTEVRV
jgi:tetratricopeptide (TPR) repeat protein